MKFELKCLVAALALTAIGAAHAEVLVINKGGATFQGISTLTLGADVLSGFDTVRISVANYGAATSAISKDTDGYYVNISSTGPMQTLSLDSESLDVVGMSASGGLTLTSPVLKSVTSGGSLTVTDIAADLRTKTISATIIGGNGVGTLTNFALWSFTTLEGPTKYTVPGTYINDMRGLTLTTDGYAKFSQALGLNQLGRVAIYDPLDFGTLHTVFDVRPWECCAPPPTPSIPEPSSHLLLGLGLLSVAVAIRRQAR